MQVCGQLSSTAEIVVTTQISIIDVTAQQTTDFALSVPTLVFQPGEIQSCTAVTAVADSILEDNEDFMLSLLSNNNLVLIPQSGGTTTVTIFNQDRKF